MEVEESGEEEEMREMSFSLLTCLLYDSTTKLVKYTPPHQYLLKTPLCHEKMEFHSNSTHPLSSSTLLEPSPSKNGNFLF
jgi:hypothetical protein